MLNASGSQKTGASGPIGRLTGLWDEVFNRVFAVFGDAPSGRLNYDRALLDLHATRSARSRRFGAGVGLVTWGFFLVIDLCEQRFEIIDFTIDLGSFLLIALFSAFTLNQNFLKYAYSETVLFFFSTLLYLATLAGLAHLDRPFDELDDVPGLILLFMAIAGIFRVRAQTCLAIAVICLPISVWVFFEATAASLVWTHATRPEHSAAMAATSHFFMRPSVYLFVAMVVGVLVSALLERDALRSLATERELSALNAALISARQDAETKSMALVAAKDELRLVAERENRSKSRFLADAAHDLSQPIHAVSMLVESARHAVERDEGPRAAAVLEDAGRAIDVARSAFKAVLEASQLQSGLVTPRVSALDAPQLVADILAPLAALADAKGVRLRVRRPRRRAAVVLSDPALLARLLTNLASNAIKYSDPKKGDKQTVLVSVTALSQNVRIDVIDNGIGIDRRDWKKIFTPLFQVANAERNREKGLGLGLSIVAAIIDLLPAHQLDMRSELGRGTRFSLKIPPYRGALQPPRLDRVFPRSSPRFNALRVLYVEDDDTARTATATFLRGLGLALETAASVVEVESGLLESGVAPDLVISDLRLPDGGSALDVARLVRDRWGRSVPMLVVTGDASPPAVEALGAGAVVLVKPVAPEDLLNAIQNLCFAAC